MVDKTKPNPECKKCHGHHVNVLTRQHSPCPNCWPKEKRKFGNLVGSPPILPGKKKVMVKKYVKEENSGDDS